jgi:hypothetical protein
MGDIDKGARELASAHQASAGAGMFGLARHIAGTAASLGLDLPGSRLA